MKLESDDFELFGVPRRFEQDRDSLDTRWRALQAEVHPDRFVGQGAAAQRLAMQWALRVNEAHQRLKDPLLRAIQLCQLAGVAVEVERNTAMPTEFLMQQMSWREALDEADGAEALRQLGDEVAAARRQGLADLGRLLDERQDFAAAAQQVRAMMFVARFAEDVDSRLERLEDQGHGAAP